MMDIKSSYKLLLSHKDLRSRNFWQWNDDPLKIFKNLYGNAFSLLVFIKGKIIAVCHLMIHIKCGAIIFLNENWRSLKQRFWNNGSSNMLSFSIFFIFSVFTSFLTKTLWKNCHFLKWFFEIYFKMYYFTKVYDLKPATTKTAVLSI